MSEFSGEDLVPVDATRPAPTRHIPAMERAKAPALANAARPSNSRAVLPAIPGYELLGELGRGAMGVVYKARQLRLQRIVALKMILAGAHAGKKVLGRFETEAQ